MLQSSNFREETSISQPPAPRHCPTGRGSELQQLHRGHSAYAGAAAVFLNKQKQRREKEIDELPCKYCCTNTPNWWSCSFASCLVTAKTHTEHDSAKVTLVLSATIKSFGCPLCLTGIQFAADSWYDLQCGVRCPKTKISDTHTWPVTWLNWSPQILG